MKRQTFRSKTRTFRFEIGDGWKGRYFELSMYGQGGHNLRLLTEKQRTRLAADFAEAGKWLKKLKLPSEKKC